METVHIHHAMRVMSTETRCENSFKANIVEQTFYAPR
jgi:hypothetical protein